MTPDAMSAVTRLSSPRAVLGVALAALLALASPGSAAAQQGEQAAPDSVPAYANPHGAVVDFLFAGLPFGVLDLTRDQKIRMAKRTARLHRGYGHDLHHLYHGGGVDGLFRQLPHLRQQVRRYRQAVIDGILTDSQRERLAAAFDEEALDRNRHGYRVLRIVLGRGATHDYYGIPDAGGAGADNLGFVKGHGAGADDRHGGGPPPR